MACTRTYEYHQEEIHWAIKVETHNHPTAVAPFPGAATGVGGELRDEAATGRGAKPKMGLSGFSVSNLNIPGWEPALGGALRQAGQNRVRSRGHARGPDRFRRLCEMSSAARMSPATSGPTRR